MYCSKCGYEFKDDTNFCRKCGSKNIYNDLMLAKKESTINIDNTSNENDINQANSKEISTKKTKPKIFIILGLLILLLSVGFGSYYISVSKFFSDNAKNSEKTRTKNKDIPKDTPANKTSEIKKDVAPPKNSNDISNIDSPTYYIFPKSGKEKLLDSDVTKYKKEHLTLARNEIYARHGFVFKSEPFKSYFKKKSWYNPNSNFKGSDGELNTSETYNIKLLLKCEKK